MGWWAEGDDIMGDHPADLVGELFQALDARLVREHLHHVSLGGLANTFATALTGDPALVSPAANPEEAADALYTTLAALCAAEGYEPVERESVAKPEGELSRGGGEAGLARSSPPPRDNDDEERAIAHLVAVGVRAISRSWQQSGEERPPRISELISAFAFVVRPDPERYLAVHEPVVARPFHHPLLGAARATLADLRARCEPDALALLDTAARVARVRTQGAFGARPDTLSLRSTDLLRALQLGGHLDPLHYAWAPSFAADTERLRAMFATDTDPPPDLALDPAWVGHVTAWLHGRTGPIDAKALLGGLDRAALAELLHHDELYEDALITRDEGIARFAAEQLQISGWSATRTYWAAHLDRDGELDALTTALAGGRVVVVRTDTLGRAPALVQAWAARVGRLPELPYTVTVDARRAHGSWFAIGPSPALRAFRTDEYDAERELAPLVEALGGGDTVIVVVEERHQRALLKHVPTLSAAPSIELGPRRDADLLARWLGVRARSQLVTGERFTLYELVEAIEAADEEDRWSFDWARLAPWRAIASRRGLLAAELRRFLRSKRPTELRVFDDSRVYQRFVQTEARLRYLAELDDTLP